MQLDFKSIDFIITTTIYKDFDFISPPNSKSSLLYSNNSNILLLLSFYIDNFFKDFKNF